MTKEEKLAEIRQRIDDLEARSRNGRAETQARLQRTFDRLRSDADAASASLDAKADAIEERFSDLETRVELAAKREASELASDPASFAEAVEAELQEWDTAIERTQAHAAERAYGARKRAEASVSELRKARNRAADRLSEARSSTDEAWEEKKNAVTAALEDLEQKAREASAKLN